MKPYSELSAREQLILDLWDLWKDCYGVRPHGIDFGSKTDEGLQELYVRLVEELG